MKVCTCLNPLHTFLAVSGCLLGYTLIADEMKDEDLLRLVKRLGYEEGLPVVVDPGTSQKLSIRFGETIKGYLGRSDLNVGDLKVVPLVFALWLRYLMAIDDNGNQFELSPDPLLEDVKKYVPSDVDALLHRKEIFGVDLFEAGLADKVKDYFSKLNKGKGSVRNLLKEI